MELVKFPKGNFKNADEAIQKLVFIIKELKSDNNKLLGERDKCQEKIDKFIKDSKKKKKFSTKSLVEYLRSINYIEKNLLFSPKFSKWGQKMTKIENSQKPLQNHSEYIV